VGAHVRLEACPARATRPNAFSLASRASTLTLGGDAVFLSLHVGAVTPLLPRAEVTSKSGLNAQAPRLRPRRPCQGHARGDIPVRKYPQLECACRRSFSNASKRCCTNRCLPGVPPPPLVNEPSSATRAAESSSPGPATKVVGAFPPPGRSRASRHESPKA